MRLIARLNLPVRRHFACLIQRGNTCDFSVPRAGGHGDAAIGRSHRLRRALGDRQGEPELELAVAIVGPDGAALCLNQSLDDRQPKAGIVDATILSGCGAGTVEAVEAVE